MDIVGIAGIVAIGDVVIAATAIAVDVVRAFLFVGGSPSRSSSASSGGSADAAVVRKSIDKEQSKRAVEYAVRGRGKPSALQLCLDSACASYYSPVKIFCSTNIFIFIFRSRWK